MAHFKYRAVDRLGSTYEATGEASDRYALAREIKEKGNTLVSVEELHAETQTEKRKSGITFGKVPLREKIMFARNLATMISAGLSLSRALSVLERQTGNAKFRDIIADLDASVQKGLPLSTALELHPKTFPSIFVAMVRAGEESGKLAESLKTLALQLDKAYQLRRRVRGAMMYPAIVVTAMVLIGVLMLIFVVPTLTETFEELAIELPASTRLIIGVSTLLKEHTILLFLSVIGVIALISTLLKSKRGRRLFEAAIIRTPLIKGLVRETNAARMARTLSSLLFAGVNVVSAISITRDVVQNGHFKDVLHEAEDSIQKGNPISGVFIAHDTLYPILVGEMMAVGEESGDLPGMLKNIAEFYEGEVEEKTKNLSTIIEPILMVIIGAAVGFFAVSMITPIYSISEGI